MDKKISIVIAYYTRKQLLYNTLKTIIQSEYKDLVEVIIVDDGGTQDDLWSLFIISDIKVRVIRVEPEDKWWHNTCIPFNIGIRAATTPIVMLQSAECLHYGDVIKYTLDNIKDGLYLCFGAYSVDKLTTSKIDKIDFSNPSFRGHIAQIIAPINNSPLKADGTNAWYNHSKYRPSLLHFCSAIMKKDLDALGGFDERYALGFGWEDSEFSWRVRHTKDITPQYVDDPFVIHQYHEPSDYTGKKELFDRNTKLYKELIGK